MNIQAGITVLSPTARGIAAALAVFFLMGPAAQQADAAECSKAQTQMAINQCAAAAFNRADKKLNAVYQKALWKQRAVDAVKIEDFKKIQRAWLAYRDLHCGFASAVYEGGSMAPAARMGCMEKLTQQRIQVIPDLFGEWEITVKESER